MGGSVELVGRTRLQRLALPGEMVLGRGDKTRGIYIGLLPHVLHGAALPISLSIRFLNIHDAGYKASFRRNSWGGPRRDGQRSRTDLDTDLVRGLIEEHPLRSGSS